MAVTRWLLVFCVVATLASTITACRQLGGSRVFGANVIQQASPNPMFGHNTFIAEPLNFENAEVAIVQEKARMPPFDQDKIRSQLTPEERKAMNEEFLKSLREQGREDGLIVMPASQDRDQLFVPPFIIRAELKVLKVGCTATITTRVTITTAADTPVDVFEIDSPRANCFAFSLAVLRDLATAQAEETLRYLARRKQQR
jgi:hypothetical protein